MTDVLDKKLFKAWPMFGANKDQVRELMLRYLGATQDLPVWAVVEAIARWRDGKWELQFGESFDKIPSSATLRRIGLHVVAVVNAELSNLERLDAAVAEIPRAEPSAEERERIGAKMRELSEEMASRAEANRQAEIEAYAPVRARFQEIADAARARQSAPAPADQEPAADA